MSPRQSRGRRDNGLDATEFVATADVDPRVGEHLLDVLALAGIAAYLQPSADLHPITRTTTLPSRPTDRLFVDRSQADRVRAVLRSLHDEAAGTADAVDEDAEDQDLTDPPTDPGPDEQDDRHDWDWVDDEDDRGSQDDQGVHDDQGVEAEADADIDTRLGREVDIDAEWERIVAELTDGDASGSAKPTNRPSNRPTSPPARGSDNVSMRKDTTHDTARDSVQDPERDEAAVDASLEALFEGPADTLPAELEPTDEEGYEPPVPPPLPRVSREVVVGVLAVAAGLLLFFWPETLGLSPSVSLTLGVFGVLGGAGMLVWQLRDGLGDDDGDDGARV